VGCDAESVKDKIVKKEYGPSQGAEMMRGLVEAAEEMRRNELVLTNQDAQMLEEMGVEAPPKFADFKCSICGAPMREGIYYLITPDGSIRCETACGPELVR